MDKKLSFGNNLFIGSMLFGLFFGAGNLIFPVHMGQIAGDKTLIANLGFLITAIGLPFLGVVAIGVSRSDGLFSLASRVNKSYGMIFTILLYLVIGPFFALPRLATTSYEIGLATFVPENGHTLALALFSVLFFVVAVGVSLRPTKLLDYVGKFLNPLFLVLLSVLIILAFLRPMGHITDAVAQPPFDKLPFFSGFTEGYNTLDALAALAFGIIVVNTVKSLGVTSPANIAMSTVKAGAISVLGMGVIYTLMSAIGTMSLGKFAISENGGIALAQISQYYLGNLGTILLAIIVIIACLKTAIGLITAFSETFVELFPGVKYWVFVLVSGGLAALFANVGLTNIIKISLPVLMFIYPLAITLILLALLSPLFKHHAIVYRTTTYVTLLVAILDGLNAAPDFVKETGFVKALLKWSNHYLPLFSVGLGWVVPATVGFVIGVVWVALKRDSNKTIA